MCQRDSSGASSRPQRGIAGPSQPGRPATLPSYGAGAVSSLPAKAASGRNHLGLDGENAPTPGAVSGPMPGSTRSAMRRTADSWFGHDRILRQGCARCLSISDVTCSAFASVTRHDGVRRGQARRRGDVPEGRPCGILAAPPAAAAVSAGRAILESMSKPRVIVQDRPCQNVGRVGSLQHPQGARRRGRACRVDVAAPRHPPRSHQRPGRRAGCAAAGNGPRTAQRAAVSAGRDRRSCRRPCQDRAGKRRRRYRGAEHAAADAAAVGRDRTLGRAAHRGRPPAKSS